MKTDGANAVQLLLFIGGISLVPALLFTVTGFTRILIVLGFIRSGLGTPTAPPNQVLVGIAFFLTLFVMSPTLKEIKTEAYDPLQKGAITQEVALKRAEAPLREFMFNQTREKDLALFVKLGKVENVETRKDVPTHVLIPAFIISELKTAFQIGFLIFLPFLIIDLVVSSTLMAMGMMMLPPVFISLPFKILLFVLVDGWNLVTGVARPELPHVMTQDSVVSLIVEMMGVTMKVALPMLLVALVVGLVISVLQAVTQIQEQTLSFIPKILGLVAVVAIAGPWMLGTVVDWSRRAVGRDPRAGRLQAGRRRWTLTSSSPASPSSRSPRSSSSWRGSRRSSCSRRCSRAR